MVFDYIIVGNGVAGSCIALNLLINNKKFIVINTNNVVSATSVSSGLYNPTVLKRFNLVWRAKDNLLELNKTYSYFESLLNKKYLFPQKIYKIFNSENDLFAWKKKMIDASLKDFLRFKEISSDKNIAYENGVGEVLCGGRIDVKNLVLDFKTYLIKNGFFFEDDFIYEQLKLEEDNEFIYYKNFKAKRIIFCEGFAIKKNPYFKYLPVEGNKGEALIVKLKDPIIDIIYKSKVTISHSQDDLNYIGTTYNFLDKELNPTKSSLEFLTQNLSKLYLNSFEIKKHIVGIRPTVVDRRPILGEHPTDKRLILFNGLGSRGVMDAPLMAKELYQFLELGKPLSHEISISRFNSKFAKNI
ncbi:MAG: NAD(P)/FAD-dependent oxidoreductase [Solirubrobacteraceae bacterium]